MLVYGISMIRNEADLVRLNVLYHLSLGVDRMLVVDNGSTDGTDGLLKQSLRPGLPCAVVPRRRSFPAVQGDDRPGEAGVS